MAASLRQELLAASFKKHGVACRENDAWASFSVLWRTSKSHLRAWPPKWLAARAWRPGTAPWSHQTPRSKSWQATPRGFEPPQARGAPGQKPGPRKGSPRKPKGKVYPPGGGTRQRDCTLGLRVLSSVDGQAYAGCLALSCMSSMATASRTSTMRCWGPRGLYSTTLQRRHPLFSPRVGACPCRVSSGCWPPRNGWETA